MTTLTRRRSDDPHHESWHVYYGDVRIGAIGEVGQTCPRSFGKMFFPELRMDPISPSYARGIIDGERTPNALKGIEGKRA